MKSEDTYLQFWRQNWDDVSKICRDFESTRWRRSCPGVTTERSEHAGADGSVAGAPALGYERCVVEDR